MYKRKVATLFALSVIVANTLAIKSSSYAQYAGIDTKTTISMQPGEIIEILPATQFPNPKVSWVLNKDGQFQQAQRSIIFSMRPTEIGNYEVQAEAVDGANTPIRSQTFVNVAQGAQPIITPPEDAIVGFDPPLAADGSLRIDPATQLLKIFSVRDDVEQYFIDLNENIDSSGDGDPANDNIVSNTIFTSGRSTLYVWMPPSTTSQNMLIAAKMTNGSILSNTVSLFGNRTGNTGGDTVQPIAGKTRIIATPTTGLGYTFAVELGSDVAPVPTVYQWNFGDGNQSILDAPQHIFAEEKSYSVSVSIRDVSTGQEVKSLSTIVQAKNVVPVDGDTGSSDEEGGKDAGNAEDAGDAKDAEDAEDAGDAKEKGKMLGWLWLILKILAVLLLSAGVGVLIMFIISKTRGKSIEKAIADAEQKHFGSEGEEKKGALSPPPMKLVATDDVQETSVKQTEEKKEEKKKVPKEDPEQKNEEKKESVKTDAEAQRNVPSWLAPAPTGSTPPAPTKDTETTGQGSGADTAPKPPAPPVPPAAPTTPKPPAPPPPPPAPKQPQSDSAPDWLQKGSTTSTSAQETGSDAAPTQDNAVTNPPAPPPPSPPPPTPAPNTGTPPPPKPPAPPPPPAPAPNAGTPPTPKPPAPPPPPPPPPPAPNPGTPPAPPKPPAPPAPAPNAGTPPVPKPPAPPPPPPPPPPNTGTPPPQKPPAPPPPPPPPPPASNPGTPPAPPKPPAPPAPAPNAGTPPPPPKPPAPPPPPPPSTPSPSTPSPAPTPPTDDMPDWLKPGGTVNGAEEAHATQKKDLEPNVEKPTQEKDSTPDNTSTLSLETGTDAPATEKPAMTKEERERERKRKKRQRYRANKKAKVQEQKSEKDQNDQQDSASTSNESAPSTPLSTTSAKATNEIPASQQDDVPDWLKPPAPSPQADTTNVTAPKTEAPTPSSPPPTPAQDTDTPSESTEENVEFIVSADSVAQQQDIPPLETSDQGEKPPAAA